MRRPLAGGHRCPSPPPRRRATRPPAPAPPPFRSCPTARLQPARTRCRRTLLGSLGGPDRVSRAASSGSVCVLAAAVLWGTTGTAAALAPEVGSLAVGAAAMGIRGLLQAGAASRG